MTLLDQLAVVTSVAEADRSTWSPCGLSMLSTITPMAERSRGRRWSLTAAWFVLGATLGGATLGALALVGAGAVRAVGLEAGTGALAVAAIAALVTASMDLGVGTTMPHHRRQVDEAWLDQYRSWVYGIGFGWQIGTGLATYIMTAAVYLTIVLAALSGSAVVAIGIGVLFGLTRGLAIGLGVRLTNPDRLRGFHRRFDELGPVVRWAVIAVQVSVATIAAAAAWGVVGGVAVLAAAITVALWSLRGATAVAARPSTLVTQR